MKDDNKKYVYIQIMISLLTLLLTPVFSGIIVSFQLSKQHLQWEQQRNIIKNDDLHTKKVQLIDELRDAYMRYVFAMVKYNMTDMHQIRLMAREKLAEDTKIFFFDRYIGLRPSEKEYKQIEDQLIYNMNEYFVAESQLRSCLFSVDATFSGNIENIISIVNDSIEFSVHDINQKNELYPEYEKIMWDLQKTRDINKYNKSISEFTRKYSPIINEKMSSAMSTLMSEMKKEADIH